MANGTSTKAKIMNYQHITHEFLKWQIVDAPNYQFSKNRRLFNTKTGREIMKVYNGGSIGYCINGKFITLAKLRSRLKRIELITLPF